MKVTKLKTVHQFRQPPWLAKSIENNADQRAKAKTKSRKNFYKLLINAFYGK